MRCSATEKLGWLSILCNWLLSIVSFLCYHECYLISMFMLSLFMLFVFEAISEGLSSVLKYIFILSTLAIMHICIVCFTSIVSELFIHFFIIFTELGINASKSELAQTVHGSFQEILFVHWFGHVALRRLILCAWCMKKKMCYAGTDRRVAGGKEASSGLYAACNAEQWSTAGWPHAAACDGQWAVIWLVKRRTRWSVPATTGVIHARTSLDQ